MLQIILFLAVIVIFLLLVPVVMNMTASEGGRTKRIKPEYKYKRKQFFLSRAENKFYSALVKAVGEEYYIFPQVHLPTILDHKIRGQRWRGAFSHINRKSVDFVLCDKEYISPKLAIELDDKTHDRPDRQERDKTVEHILKEAGMSLLRIRNHGDFNPNEIATQIKGALQ